MVVLARVRNMREGEKSGNVQSSGSAGAERRSYFTTAGDAVCVPVALQLLAGFGTRLLRFSCVRFFLASVFFSRQSGSFNEAQRAKARPTTGAAFETHPGVTSLLTPHYDPVAGGNRES